MSKNTDNSQENIDQNSPKSFKIMANALGVTESEFVELEKQKELELQEWEDLISPPEFRDADKLYKETLYKILRCLEESAPVFASTIPIIKEHGYGKCLFAIRAIKMQVQILETQIDDCE